MEAKEKAIDLKVKFLEMIPNDIIQDNEVAAELARVNAMICVGEFITDSSYDGRLVSAQYWISVRQELLKMK